MLPIRKLRRFRSLGPVGRAIALEAFLLPIAISLGFRVIGVPRTQAWLRRWARPRERSATGGNEATEIRRACQAQKRVRRLTGIEGPCLVRSMTLWAILLRRGLEADLRVGFRKREGKVEGHAWVEYGGVPLNETATEAKTFAVYAQPASFDLWKTDLWKRRNAP